MASRQPSFKDSADECRNLLQQLHVAVHSANVQPTRRNNKYGLVRDVERRVKDALRVFKAWYTEFSRPDKVQTQDPRVIQDALNLTSALAKSITDAETSLKDRLNCRGLVPFLSKRKRLCPLSITMIGQD